MENIYLINLNSSFRYKNVFDEATYTSRFNGNINFLFQEVLMTDFGHPTRHKRR